MKLFFKSITNLFTAKSVNHAVDNGKKATYEFTSICKTLTIELVISSATDWTHFDYSITLSDALIGSVYDITTGKAMSVADIKEALQLCVLAYNEENPAFEAERAEYDAAYAALKNFSDDLIETNSEKLALETLLAVAVEQGKDKAAARLTDLLTNDFDYENNGYMISSLEHGYQDLFVWDAATVAQLHEVIQYIDNLPTAPAPAPTLSNLDAEKPVIDVNVSVKVGGNGGGFAWCAESEEYKVFADSKADAIKEITEAMILDGITNPVLNIITEDNDPEPTPPATKATETNPEAPEATEGDNVSEYTISTAFAKHGYSKAKCDGFEIIYDDKDHQVCAVRGSLRSRLAVKWLIVDGLVNGRSEQQNEDDFAALPVGDYFDLVLENGLTVGAEKVSELEVSFSMFGRHTVLVFANHWLVVNNPAYKEAFAALPVGEKLKCSGERFTIRSHSMGSDNTPRVGLVNGQGQVMSLSVESVLSEIASGKSELIENTKNMDEFKCLPIGEPLEITLGNGRSVEALKTSDRCFHFKHYGTFKRQIITPNQRLYTGFTSHANYKLIQDPYNAKKQYILKRENFQEVIIFQLVDGLQVGRVKLTEEEVLLTYDFIYQYQLNTLLSTQSDSATRLYKHKIMEQDHKHPNVFSDAAKLGRIADKVERQLNWAAYVGKEEASQPLIVRTAKAMKAVSGWGSWWLNKPVDAVLREAEAAGYVVRRSTTQIGWSDKGLAALKK